MTKRILHVIETLGHGGAEHQLALTTELLDPARFTSHVCHLHAPDHLRTRIERTGATVTSLDLPVQKRRWPEAAYVIARLIRELRIDLVHTSLFEADLAGGLAGKLTNTPVINTFCNIGGESERLLNNPRNSALKLRISTEIWSGVLRAAHTHHIAISQAVKESAIRTYGVPADRVSVIYRALPPRTHGDEEAIQKLKQNLGLEDAFPILLNVGRLAPQKGQRYAVEALPEIVHRFPTTRLLIVGEGWLQEELTSIARRLGVEAHLEFLGRREDVPDLMLMSDLFVFPSLFEGLGVSVLQAASLGLPCVTSDVGPIPEVLTNGETGRLVPPRNPRALADAILELSADRSGAQRMGDAAKAHVGSEFTGDRMATELQALYDRLLEPSLDAQARGGE